AENLPAGTLSEVIERAVRSNMQINGAGDTGRKAGRGAGSRIEDPDPAAAQISEEILTDVGGRELSYRRGIKSGADNGAAGSIGRAVTIEEDRAAERWIACWTFGCRPAVVRTGNAVIDFFP